MPYAFTSLAKFSGPRRYDNHAPRDYLDKLEGWRKRAHWAQLNCFEAFAPFAAAVIVAQQVGVAQGRVDLLAMVFVVTRLVYGSMYVIDQPRLRSAAWGIAFSCVIILFLTAGATAHA
jgi:uncharacterized MAPEG superfamily protein